MQTVVVLCLLVAGVFSVTLKNDGELFEVIDVEKILADDELRNSAFSCLVGQTPCREDQVVIQQYLPRILASKCGDCTPTQKATFEKSLEYLKTNHNDLYTQMFEKFGH